MPKLTIRESQPSDLESVLTIERNAFEQNDEADLVEKLLIDPTAKPLLSLLAFKNEKAVGHILFTSVTIEPKTHCSAYILCPMAVLPEFQKKGIGSQLIESGLKILSDRHADLVFVLGYPSYYSKHGFKPAGILGFQPTYPVEEKNADAWMVIELKSDAIKTHSGKIICAETLNQPEYWIE